MSRKITDQLTYVTIERNGVAHTYHKTPSPNTRLSTAWDLTLAKKDVKRISYASYVRLHTLMMKQHVVTTGTTMTVHFPAKMVAPAPVAAPAVEETTDRETAFQADMDNVADTIERWANWQQKRWNFLDRTGRFDRWDYVAELEHQMELALGRKDLGYSLDI